MITLVLSDGSKIEVENESSRNNIVFRTKSFAEIETLKSTINEKTIDGAELDGVTLTDIVFDGIHAYTENDIIRVEFAFRDKTVDERLAELSLAKSDDRIHALEKTVAELAEKINKITK